ncbi:MAG: aromatic ring-hydroxylating dioxygenase subunit alpha [Gammaproteobacteria bacterium]|nr:aromatic ring-hydroxylating dioxygenase subunit alpha [Gammaproteobacteria bacterium]
MRQDTRTIAELISSHKQGYSLDQRFYTDPAIFELELERIITRNWILAGHQSELPEPGDFKVLNVANESAIIVRGSDGILKGFANVCRHRGSLVCLESKGSTRKFVCPYHGWMYDIDGNLTAARNMPDDFDKSEYGLKAVSADTVHGLVFVCFTDKPLSLEGAKKDLAEPMAVFDFENLKVAAHKSYDIPANWKLSIENYQECYHCATAHPEYARMHTLMLDGEKRRRLQGEMLGRMKSCGLPDLCVDYLDTKARPGEIGYGYSRTALFDGYVTGSEDGKPLAPLLGGLSGYDGGASDFSFGAFSFLLAYSDHVVAYVFTPTDKDNSRCGIYWLVRNDAEAGKDYDVDRLTWLWDVTTQADKSIIVNNSKGVHSRYYEPGPFSGMERAEKIYIDWILQELQRE